MVRLRTNRWYGLDGQRRIGRQVSSQSVGKRRVVSLCLLLAMVIVLMQTVSDPMNVQRAFSSLGVPLGESPSLLQISQESDSADGKLSNAEPFEASAQPADVIWSTTCRDLVPRLLDEQTSGQINFIAHRWFAGKHSAASEELASNGKISQLRESSELILAKMKQQLDADPQAANQALISEPGNSMSTWQASFSSFETQWDRLLTNLGDQQLEPPRLEFDATFSDALGQYLDGRLTQSLRDGQTWQPSEFVAFWRAMQKARDLGHAANDSNVPYLNTFQLEAEAGNFRGKIIGFRGSVRRVERIERSNPDFGFESGYWQIWLRGDDNSTQPIAVYSSARSLENLESVDPKLGATQTEVKVIAIASKRLAYSSEAGVEVAPTLFAIQIDAIRPASVDTVPASMSAKSWREIGLAVVTAIMIAIAVSFSLFRRRSRRAERGRK